MGADRNESLRVKEQGGTVEMKFGSKELRVDGQEEPRSPIFDRGYDGAGDCADPSAG